MAEPGQPQQTGLAVIGEALATSLEFYVYHLLDPETKLPFYVGKGSGARAYTHVATVLRGCRLANLELHNRITEIISRGQRPVEQLVFRTQVEQEAFAFEIAEIQRLGRDKLCNKTDGGEGGAGARWSYAARQRHRETMRGRIAAQSKAQANGSTEPFVYAQNAKEHWIEGIGWCYGILVDGVCLIRENGVALAVQLGADGVPEIFVSELTIALPLEFGSKKYLLRKTPRGGLQLTGA